MGLKRRQVTAEAQHMYLKQLSSVCDLSLSEYVCVKRMKYLLDLGTSDVE